MGNHIEIHIRETLIGMHSHAQSEYDSYQFLYKPLSNHNVNTYVIKPSQQQSKLG